MGKYPWYTSFGGIYMTLQDATENALLAFLVMLVLLPVILVLFVIAKPVITKVIELDDQGKLSWGKVLFIGTFSSVVWTILLLVLIVSLH